MRNSFDAADFVKNIGNELVRAFETARTATTSELVGDAMETPVRERLEQVLPQGIGVGSGCVIDTQSNTSRQLDVVLYEKGICPVFCVNNSPETTYYPCEVYWQSVKSRARLTKRSLLTRSRRSRR